MTTEANGAVQVSAWLAGFSGDCSTVSSDSLDAGLSDSGSVGVEELYINDGDCWRTNTESSTASSEDDEELEA